MQVLLQKSAFNLSWKQFVAGDPLGLGGPPHQQHEGRHQQEGSWDDGRPKHGDFGQNKMTYLQSPDSDSDMGQTELKGGHEGGHEHYEDYHHGHSHEDDIDDRRSEGQSHAVFDQGDKSHSKEDFFDYDLL